MPHCLSDLVQIVETMDSEEFERQLDELERQSNVVEHPPCNQSDQQNKVTNEPGGETSTGQPGRVRFY